MRQSPSANSLGQISEVSEENWAWLRHPTRRMSAEQAPADVKVHIQPPAGAATITATGAVAGAAAAATAPTPGKHYKDEPIDKKKKMRSLIIWASIVVAIVVPSVVGPVYYFTVLLPRDRAAAEAAKLPPVPPLPPLKPVTEVFYDDFSDISSDNWGYMIGNGLNRGWSFKGFGLDELQCFEEDPSNAATIPHPLSPNSTVLRLQAVYHPNAVTCVPDQAPYNSTTTFWTSGGVRTMGKRLFHAPTALATRGDSTADNCTSLIIEARMKFPAVKGTRAGLRLLPEPQDQPADAPRCEWADECGAYGAWPNSGEIGLADHKDTGSVEHAIQIREYGQHAWRAAETPLGDTAVEWHEYKLEWNCDYLRWFVDGQKVHGVSRFDVSEWPFDQPFYMAISYSVGGRLVDPNVALVNSSMLVDYVRVYPAIMEPPTSNVVVTAGGSRAAAGNVSATTSNNNSNNTANSTTAADDGQAAVSGGGASAGNATSSSNGTESDTAGVSVPVDAAESSSADNPAAFSTVNATAGGAKK